MIREFDFEWQESHLDMPQWMLASRRHYFSELTKKGLPTKKNEHFRYTDLSDIKKYLSAAKKESVSEIALRNEKIAENSIRLVFQDQIFQPDCSDLHLLPEGVIACSLKEALEDHEAIIKEAWPLAFDVSMHPIAALNIASLQQGFFFYVPPTCEINTPFHFLQLTTKPCAFDNVQLIVIGQASKISIFEEIKLSTFSFQHQFCSMLLNENATLTHCILTNNEAESCYWRTTMIQEKKHAKASFVSCLLGGKFTRHDLTCRLQEPFTDCKTSAFYHVNQEAYVDHHIEMLHLAPYTESDMLFKGTISDSGKAVFNGRLYIEKNAQKINAHQTNHHLLFSDRAESYSKPELEIYADDVKCKHGATTAAFDYDAIFYLRSRGLTENAAKALLLDAFLESVLNRIELPLDFLNYIMHSIKGVSYDI